MPRLVNSGRPGRQDARVSGDGQCHRAAHRITARGTWSVAMHMPTMSARSAICQCIGLRAGSATVYVQGRLRNIKKHHLSKCEHASASAHAGMVRTISHPRTARSAITWKTLLPVKLGVHRGELGAFRRYDVKLAALRACERARKTGRRQIQFGSEFPLKCPQRNPVTANGVLHIV